MLAAAVVLLLGQIKRYATVSLSSEPEGIVLEASVWEGTKLRFLDTSKARVLVKGPAGNEPVQLTALTTSRQHILATRVDVDRSSLAGWRTMIVEDPGVSFPTSPPRFKTSLRYYLPAKETEAEDEVVRRKWVGKKAWLLGSAVWDGDNTLGWNPEDPVTILDCKRLNGPVGEGCDCPAWNVFNGWRSTSMLCAGCLDVTVLLPKGAWSALVMGASVNLTNKDDRHPVFAPIKGHLYLADWWQLDRAFRTTSPTTILNKESAKVGEAFVNREIVKGMPRSLVALLVGDPEPSAPASEVWRRTSWHWLGGAFNGEYIISFDANGRVTDFGLAMPQLP